MTDTKTKIAAISGSLRKGSYNTATLRALQELAPDSIELDLITLEGVEPFNEDVEAEGWPPRVQALRDRVEPAAAVIIATPEYNYSFPGTLKNALDWLSRPTGRGPIVGKPLLIVGASLSKTGTARAQAHLRQVAFYNAMPVMPTAEVLISNADKVFDESGKLADSGTREFLETTIKKFSDWVGRHA